MFPLPETAAVDHLRMKVGERIIEGQIKEKAEAKKVYEQANVLGYNPAAAIERQLATIADLQRQLAQHGADCR